MGILEQLREMGREEGRALGLKDGLEKGLKKGELRAQRAFVRKSRKLGLSDKLIAQITGLSLKGIRMI